MSDDQLIDETRVEAVPATAPISDESDISTDDPNDVVLDDMAVVDSGATGARLVVKRNGSETDDQFELNPPCVIGRFDPGVGPVDVDLGPLPEGVYVSRKHAKIGFEDGVWSIEDLGSSNGTFILKDGQFERVETAPLEDGTEFALGNARFVFHM